jgi:hypothetical protein
MRMKPENMLLDEKILAEKNKSRYYKRMKKDKYYKLGWKACKKKDSKQDNPYKLTPDILKLLRKRTLWLMGFDDCSYQPTKKRLAKEAELQQKRKHEKHKHHRNHKHK